MSGQSVMIRALTPRQLVEHAMKIMVWYLSWTAVKVTQEDVDSEPIREKIEKHRDETLRVLNEYAVGNHSNADEAVRREVSRRRCWWNATNLYPGRYGSLAILCHLPTG
jgi:hypothetical protein